MRRMLAMTMMLLMTTAALAGCAGSEGFSQEDIDAAREEGRAAGIAEATPVSTLDTIVERGSMKCGVKESQYGMGYLDAGTGVRSGLDISYCRAVAAALGLNPDTDVEYIPASGSDRFDKLASGTIDVLIRTTTWTTSRDADLNADFAGMNFFDGQGILVRADSYDAATAGNSAAGLDGANICVGIGTTTEGNMVDWFSSRNIAFTSVPVADAAEATAKFIDGSCDALVDDRVILQGLKIALDADGSMNGVDIWITTDSMGVGSSRQTNPAPDLGVVPTGDGWSVLNITLSQDQGEMSSLYSVYALVTVTGTCVSNCSNQSDEIVHGLEFYWMLSPPSMWMFSSPYEEVLLSTECEMGFDSDLQFGTQFGPPGLSCELDLMMFADFSVTSTYWPPYEIENIDDYEFEWGDWTYHIMWLSAPVQME